MLSARSSTGCRTKDGAFAVLRELTGRAEKVKAQILTPEEDRIADQQAVSLDEHFEAYLTHLRAKDSSDVHVSGTRRLAERLCRDCHFALLRDVHRDLVEQWLVERKAEGMAARTRNSYLQAVRGFCNWCVATGRLVRTRSPGSTRRTKRPIVADNAAP